MPRGLESVTFWPPKLGSRSDEQPHRLPELSVPADSTQNVIMRDGDLVNRPGMKQITSNLLTGRPTGGTVFQFAVGAKTIIGTTAGWYAMDGSKSPPTWTDLTGGTALAGDADSPVRFAVWPTATSLVVMGVNRYANVPYTWDGNAAAYSALGGSPPPAGDITTAANRVLLCDTLESGVVQPYRVRHSGFNVNNTWASTDFADLSDTPDQMVAIRSLSRVAVAIYKQQSEWIGLSQQGLFPFKYELQDKKPGPVSPAVVVDADGRHYYLGVDLSIYTFDGIRATHIGEPIRRWIIKNSNDALIRRAFGVYVRRDRDVWFFFPSPGSTSCDRAVSINIDTGRAFPHVLGQSVTAGFQWGAQASVSFDDLASFTFSNIAATYPTFASFSASYTPIEMLTTVGGLAERFGLASTDDGVKPTATWRQGPLPIAGNVKRARVQSYETYFAQASAAQTVTSRIGTTDTLGTDPTFPAELSNTFDASVDALHKFDTDTATPGAGTGLAEARFVSMDHQVVTAGDWKWKGGAVLFDPQETD